MCVVIHNAIVTTTIAGVYVYVYGSKGQPHKIPGHTADLIRIKRLRFYFLIRLIAKINFSELMVHEISDQVGRISIARKTCVCVCTCSCMERHLNHSRRIHKKILSTNLDVCRCVCKWVCYQLCKKINQSNPMLIDWQSIFKLIEANSIKCPVWMASRPHCEL